MAAGSNHMHTQTRIPFFRYILLMFTYISAILVRITRVFRPGFTFKVNKALELQFLQVTFPDEGPNLFLPYVHK
jgi:hypothetical protein